MDIDYATVFFLAVAFAGWLTLCWVSTRKPKAVRCKSEYWRK